MTNLTVHDLIGEDHEIQVTLLNGEKHVAIDIHDENSMLVEHLETHIYAWESLVSFAKQVLACDERLRQEIEIND